MNKLPGSARIVDVLIHRTPKFGPPPQNLLNDDDDDDDDDAESNFCAFSLGTADLCGFSSFAMCFLSVSRKPCLERSPTASSRHH